ncbi:DUF4974 domain-containing protein [Fulvivirgaceae bacterium BMA12]|uniref:DUF4974 domain-containing protein n=1 Tax=Agaribacillus aureus TaxID=3051825 RepID=A0ABT8L257_9BACT|nr:DUF4974 domain-containing protein [Fulvivirgaceae bacterium BMA12]
MDKKLLERFFNGNCSPAEVDKIVMWYYSGELSDEIAESLKVYFNDPENAQKETNWDSKALFDKITHDIYGSRPKAEENPRPLTEGSGNSSPFPFWLKIAAGISVLMAVSILFVMQTDFLKSQEQALNQNDYVVKSTSPSERLMVRLTDGSEVILNAGSKIRYLRNFDPDRRTVTLEGEAFFVIEKDKSRPFTVISDGISTTALGTSFNVNTEPGAGGKVEIALVEGSVIVGRAEDMYRSERSVYLAEEEQVILKPGEKLSLSPGGQQLNPFDVKEVVGWKDGIIYFKNVPFQQVIKKLEKSYQVEFEVIYQDPQQRNQRYSGEFQNRSLEYILRNLSFSSDFKFEIDGDKIKIMFN